MDIYCLRCGEPWDLTEIAEMVENGEIEITEGKVKGCPACFGKDEKVLNSSMSNSQRSFLENMETIAELMGDDLDGQATAIQDLMDMDS